MFIYVVHDKDLYQVREGGRVKGRTKLDESAIADIRSIKSPADYTKKLEVSCPVCCHSIFMVSMSTTVKTVVFLLIAVAAFLSFQLATFLGLNGLFPNTTVSVPLSDDGLGHESVGASRFRYEWGSCDCEIFVCE